MKQTKLYEEAKETFLQILLLAERKWKEFIKEGDIKNKETLEKEVIEKYESLYLALEEKSMDSLETSKIEEIKKMLKEIQAKHHFSKAYLEEKQAERKKLQGHSGAEVVKRLYEYQKKELEKQKRKLLQHIDTLSKQEETKNRELCDAIQEEEQIEIIEELQYIRRNYQKNLKKAIAIQKKIDYTVREIEKKWKYEIFGTIPEQKMKNIGEEFFQISKTKETKNKNI